MLPDPRGVGRHLAIENPSGLITTIQTPDSMSRLSAVSQLGPITLHESRKAKYQWPLLREDYIHLAIEERIAMVGGVTEWRLGRACVPADCVDAGWRIYPKGLLGRALPEMLLHVVRPRTEILKPVRGFDGTDSITASAPHVTGGNDRIRCDWSCADVEYPIFRTGGIEPRKVSAGLVGDALCHRKLGALFAGLSTSTRTRYLRGWEHWRQFCNARKISPWIDTTNDNWDGNSPDFIMYVGAVLKLAPIDYPRGATCYSIRPHSGRQSRLRSIRPAI